MEKKFTEGGQVIRGVTFDDSERGSRSATPLLRTGTPNTISRLDSRQDSPDKPSTAASSKSRDSRQRSRERSKSRERGRSHERRGKGNQDFMKDLLETNAKRKYRKDKGPPLEDRITDFFSRIDSKTTGIHELSAEEKKRQWIKLMNTKDIHHGTRAKKERKKKELEDGSKSEPVQDNVSHGESL